MKTEALVGPTDRLSWGYCDCCRDQGVVARSMNGQITGSLMGVMMVKQAGGSSEGQVMRFLGR